MITIHNQIQNVVLTKFNMDATVTVNVNPCPLWSARRLECYATLTLVCYPESSCCCLTNEGSDRRRSKAIKTQ